MGSMPSVTRRLGASSPSSLGAAERLVSATERVLACGTPYIELSVEQLCSEAGVARSTFYVHFRDKGELVVRVAERMLEQLTAAAAEWWQPGHHRGRLLASTRRLVDVYAAHRAVMVALRETAIYDPKLRAIQDALLERHAAPLAALIEVGKGDGSVRAEIHTRETVIALVGMVEATCAQLADGDEEGLQRLAATVTAIAWHALYPDEATA